MKVVTTVVAFILAAFLAVANGQVTIVNGTYTCSPGGGTYCAGDSLTSNILIRCQDKVGTPANCNDNLAGEPPVGVKTFAPCYESSPTAGDAACSWNCTAYPDSGVSFALPAEASSVCFVPGPGSTASTSSSGGVTSSPSASQTIACPDPTDVAALSASASASDASPSELSAIFSSLLGCVGNETVSAISEASSVPPAVSAITATITSSTASPAVKPSSTTTITTTLNETVSLASPTLRQSSTAGAGTAAASSPFSGGAAPRLTSGHDKFTPWFVATFATGFGYYLSTIGY